MGKFEGWGTRREGTLGLREKRIFVEASCARVFASCYGVNLAGASVLLRTGVSLPPLRKKQWVG